ncbi:reverse transcriptase domain-containing protein [Tanacetum coccineum]
MTLIYEYLTKETLPVEVNKARAVRQKSQRFTVINGILYKKSFLRPWLRCVGPLQANYVIREIHEGSCSMHAGTRSVVAKALRTGYYWPTMHKDSRALIRACQDRQVHRPIPRNPQQKLNPITSLWPFYKWRIDIAGPFPKGQALGINLDLLEERREQAAIRKAKSKAKMEKYYNSKVCSTSFKPGDLMYHSNDASQTKEVGKLGPKWEGPYEIMEALSKGAYKLRDRDGKQLPRTWNVCNLKKCYVHEM